MRNTTTNNFMGTNNAKQNEVKIKETLKVNTTIEKRKSKERVENSTKIGNRMNTN